MSLALIALASSFTCISPSHHDGDNMRCTNIAQSIRLQGIDAPEMPGACNPGRACTPGDPFAARDHLRSLTRGRRVECEQQDTDAYGRIIARCSAGGIDLSCAMIESGHAVPRYAPIACGGSAASNSPLPEELHLPPPEAARPLRRVEPPPVLVPADFPARPARAPGTLPPALLPALIWLLVVNLATWLAFATDKARKTRYLARFHPERRIPETALLGLAALGGSPAAWAAMWHLNHKIAKPAFRWRMMLISAVQAGAAIGGLWWLTN